MVGSSTKSVPETAIDSFGEFTYLERENPHRWSTRTGQARLWITFLWNCAMGPWEGYNQGYPGEWRWLLRNITKSHKKPPGSQLFLL